MVLGIFKFCLFYIWSDWVWAFAFLQNVWYISLSHAFKSGNVFSDCPKVYSVFISEFGTFCVWWLEIGIQGLLLCLKWKILICPWFCSFLPEMAFFFIHVNLGKKHPGLCPVLSGTRRGLCLVTAALSVAELAGRCGTASALQCFSSFRGSVCS